MPEVTQTLCCYKPSGFLGIGILKRMIAAFCQQSTGQIPSKQHIQFNQIPSVHTEALQPGSQAGVGQICTTCWQRLTLWAGGGQVVGLEPLLEARQWDALWRGDNEELEINNNDMRRNGLT